MAWKDLSDLYEHWGEGATFNAKFINRIIKNQSYSWEHQWTSDGIFIDINRISRSSDQIRPQKLAFLRRQRSPVFWGAVFSAEEFHGRFVRHSLACHQENQWVILPHELCIFKSLLNWGMALRAEKELLRLFRRLIWLQQYKVCHASKWSSSRLLDAARPIKAKVIIRWPRCHAKTQITPQTIAFAILDQCINNAISRLFVHTCLMV